MLKVNRNKAQKPKQNAKKTHKAKKVHTKQKRSFRPTIAQQSNPRRDKLAEAVLNIVPPTKPKWQTLSSKPVSQPGEFLQTGADMAPTATVALPDHEDLTFVDNPIIYLPNSTQEQRNARQLFFNTFPRQTASPAGPILQTKYTNYSIYNQPIDWAKRMPGCLVRISIKEKPDYTTLMDTRWYKEAMPRPKARVDIHMRSLKFLSKLEQAILGEILGPRYNWKSGRITMSVQNLRNRHANINRCFQYLHEAAFRAIEIAPLIAEQQDIDHREYQRQVAKNKTEEINLQKALQPFEGHKRRPAVPAPEEQPQFVTRDGLNFQLRDPSLSVDEQAAQLPDFKTLTLGKKSWDLPTESEDDTPVPLQKTFRKMAKDNSVNAVANQKF